MKDKTYIYLVAEDTLKCPSCHTYALDSWHCRSDSKYNEFFQKSKLCSQFDRLILDGVLWWKKYCTLIDSHYHMHCPVCQCNFITHQGDILKDLKQIILFEENK